LICIFDKDGRIPAQKNITRSQGNNLLKSLRLISEVS
jgi:hypothetical protein